MKKRGETRGGRGRERPPSPPPRFPGVQLNSLPTYRRALLCERLEQAICQLTVKPKANLSCQLNFRPFVSCQLTPSRPSSLAGLYLLA